MEKNFESISTIKSGNVYGELTVIEEDVERENKNRLEKGRTRKYYICKCSCGEYKSVQADQLVRDRVQSCGHLRHQKAFGRNSLDISGQKFGHLTALYLDDNRNGTKGTNGLHAYWMFECDLCGSVVSARGSDLRTGIKTDCGCLKQKKSSDANVVDLVGKVFGRLTVIERDMVKGYKCGQHAYWNCKCDCGRTESVSSAMLTVYGKDRCNICMGVSNGEEKIIDLLEDNDIPFVHDKPYKDAKFSDSYGVPRFDFRITKNTDCDYMIEFDGEQHVKAVPMYGGEKGLKRTQERDRQKNQWCHDNNIPIIRIPHTRLRKLCLEDLLLETSSFVVSPISAA